MTEHESKAPYPTDPSVKYVVNQPEAPVPPYTVQQGYPQGYQQGYQQGYPPGVVMSPGQPAMQVYGQPGVTVLQPVVMQPGTPSPTYKGWSIANLVLGIFFNLITMCLAIAALVSSIDAENHNRMGNFAAAMSSSRSARSLNIAGTVLLVIGIVIAIIIIAVVLGTAAAVVANANQITVIG